MKVFKKKATTWLIYKEWVKSTKEQKKMLWRATNIQIPYVNLMITSTTNNIFITAYNTFGITLFQESSGCLGKGFKKAKRDTRYTFKKLMNVAFRSLTKINIYYIYLKFKNTFFDKVDFCFNYLEKFSFKVISIQEIKKLPYNGCRLKKEKRK